MNSLESLLQLLADGQFYSGPQLGSLLNLSRGAIWKAVRALRGYGLTIDVVKGRGYRLSGGVELLDKKTIMAGLSPWARGKIQALEVLFQVHSTNRYLLEKASLVQGDVCLAEMQTAGQGRRGRSWYSPFGHNIYLSLAWEFASGASRLSGLSLAIGLMVIEALKPLEAVGLGLKWPNDVVVGEKKLGGILIELRGDLSGPCMAVIGIGLNVRLPEQASRFVDNPIIDLASLTTRVVSRNILVIHLLQTLGSRLAEFAENGFAAFADHFGDNDVLCGRTVRVMTSQGVVDGVAEGVTDRGDLKVFCEGRTRTFNSAEVSVRL